MRINEIMNLYNLSDDPTKLPGYEQANQTPELAWSMIEASKKTRLQKIKAFKEKEDVWAKDPETVMMYVRLTGERFLKGEPVMLLPQNNRRIRNAFNYWDLVGDCIEDKTNGRTGMWCWPEGEKCLFKSMGSLWMIEYIKKFKRKGVEPELLKIIAKEPLKALAYSLKILKGTFPEGEAAMAKNAGTAFHYATQVLKAPWPPGEAAIQKDPGFLLAYKQKFGSQNKLTVDPVVERDLFKAAMAHSYDMKQLIKYMKDHLNIDVCAMTGHNQKDRPINIVTAANLMMKRLGIK